MCAPARHGLVEAISCEMLARPLGPDVSPVVGDPAVGPLHLLRGHIPSRCTSIASWGCAMSTNTERNLSGVAGGIDGPRIMIHTGRGRRRALPVTANNSPYGLSGAPSTADISTALFLSESTVKTHINRILANSASATGCRRWCLHTSVVSSPPALRCERRGTSGSARMVNRPSSDGRGTLRLRPSPKGMGDRVVEGCLRGRGDRGGDARRREGAGAAGDRESECSGPLGVDRTIPSSSSGPPVSFVTATSKICDIDWDEHFRFFVTTCGLAPALSGPSRPATTPTTRPSRSTGPSPSWPPQRCSRAGISSKPSWVAIP
jgi:hypothetical protein